MPVPRLYAAHSFSNYKNGYNARNTHTHVITCKSVVHSIFYQITVKRMYEIIAKAKRKEKKRKKRPNSEKLGFKGYTVRVRI